jgi:hypothetical protein
MRRVGPSAASRASLGSTGERSGVTYIGGESKCSTLSTSGSSEQSDAKCSSISISGPEIVFGKEAAVSITDHLGRKSRCEPFEAAIYWKMEVGLSVQRIYQDLVRENGFLCSYQSIKLFVRRLKARQPARVWRVERQPEEWMKVGGGTAIAGGTILTQNASALGTGPVAFNNGTTLQVQNVLNVNGNWTVFPGSATVSGGAVQTLGEYNTNANRFAVIPFNLANPPVTLCGSNPFGRVTPQSSYTSGFNVFAGLARFVGIRRAAKFDGGILPAGNDAAD